MIISTNKKKYLKLEKKYLKYESSNMTPNIRIKWKSAHKDKIIDIDNKCYIDFTSGIFTSNIGYNNKTFKKFINKALNNGYSHSYSYYNEYREKYISELIKFVDSPKLKKCFLASAGTETTEAAIKLSRVYGLSSHKEKIGIIAIKGNWHGRTMGATMLSGNNEHSKWIGHFDRNIFHIDFPYPWRKNNKDNFFQKSIHKRFGKKFNFKKKICMFMLETFQGWGAIFYPKNYVKQISSFCKKNNILLCFDEMQAGFGRTGKKFGFEHYGVQPDMICCGKGMGSGFPLSGLIGSNKVFNNKNLTGMSSTHSANPVACAAGLATIKIIKKQNLIKNSFVKGKILKNGLNNLQNKFPKLISGTYGNGLIASIIFKHYKHVPSKNLADQVSQKCLKEGLLVCNTGRESIKIGPPLSINQTNILKGLKIIEKALTGVNNEISK